MFLVVFQSDDEVEDDVNDALTRTITPHHTTTSSSERISLNMPEVIHSRNLIKEDPSIWHCIECADTNFPDFRPRVLQAPMDTTVDTTVTTTDLTTTADDIQALSLSAPSNPPSLPLSGSNEEETVEWKLNVVIDVASGVSKISALPQSTHSQAALPLPLSVLLDATKSTTSAPSMSTTAEMAASSSETNIPIPSLQDNSSIGLMVVGNSMIATAVSIIMLGIFIVWRRWRGLRAAKSTLQAATKEQPNEVISVGRELKLITLERADSMQANPRLSPKPVSTGRTTPSSISDYHTEQEIDTKEKLEKFYSPLDDSQNDVLEASVLPMIINCAEDILNEGFLPSSKSISPKESQLCSLYDGKTSPETCANPLMLESDYKTVHVVVNCESGEEGLQIVEKETTIASLASIVSTTANSSPESTSCAVDLPTIYNGRLSSSTHNDAFVPMVDNPLRSGKISCNQPLESVLGKEICSPAILFQDRSSSPVSSPASDLTDEPLRTERTAVEKDSPTIYSPMHGKLPDTILANVQSPSRNIIASSSLVSPCRSMREIKANFVQKVLSPNSPLVEKFVSPSRPLVYHDYLPKRFPTENSPYSCAKSATPATTSSPSTATAATSSPWKQYDICFPKMASIGSSMIAKKDPDQLKHSPERAIRSHNSSPNKTPQQMDHLQSTVQEETKTVIPLPSFPHDNCGSLLDQTVISVREEINSSVLGTSLLEEDNHVAKTILFPIDSSMPGNNEFKSPFKGPTLSEPLSVQCHESEIPSSTSHEVVPRSPSSQPSVSTACTPSSTPSRGNVAMLRNYYINMAKTAKESTPTRQQETKTQKRFDSELYNRLVRSVPRNNRSSDDDRSLSSSIGDDVSACTSNSAHSIQSTLSLNR